ncbi:MAG: histidine ammonia-lyase [Phycisphaerae bacterium]
MPAPAVTIDEAPLSPRDVVLVARHAERVLISERVGPRLAASRAVVEAALGDGLPHYGINTGFGSLSRRRIASAELALLQRNLVRSHAAGVLDPLPTEVVRGMMLLLAASLARGCSGVRPIVVDTIVQMLNAGVTPVVPSVGSVGASGDLAPLAAVGLALIGEGHCTTRNADLARSTAEAMAQAGITPLSLEAKEGLALINGTHLMAARGAIAVHDAERSLDAALLAAAMSLDACRGTDASLDARIHAARGQPGQIHVAAALRRLLGDSQIIPSHREDDPRVQDPYSLRCTPQVVGAALDAVGYVAAAVARELGAVTDNPLVFAPSHPLNTMLGENPSDLPGGGESIVSGGNFHGMALAIPLDVMCIALSHVAGISERRVFWMISAFDAESRLKPYLAANPGLDSGLMIAQYTAAACCNEMITLCTPASVSNISTSAGIEDYNSFGPRAAAKASRTIDLLDRVIAVELLAAAEGLEAHRPLRSGSAVEAAHALIRSHSPRLTGDRPLTPDIEAIASCIRQGAFSNG